MISFVILHYLVSADTRKCIDSILALPDTSDYSIVVVDNHSDNGSFEEIKKIYSHNTNVYMIANKHNEGFARGNNVGYSFSRDTLDADTIVVINNDCFIDQSDFIIRLRDICKQGYDLIGPDIVNIKDNKHQSSTNPPADYKKDYSHYSKLLTIYRALPNFAAQVFYDYVEKPRSARAKEDSHKILRQTNVQLHGACLIFANQFVKNEEIAFNPNTFLYLEEDLLFQYCMRNDYSIVFDPDIKVKHNASSSTNARHSGFKKRRINNLQHLKHSASIVIDEISRYGRY